MSIKVKLSILFNYSGPSYVNGICPEKKTRGRKTEEIRKNYIDK